MYIRNLKLKNYRNIKNLDLQFSDHINLIVEKNGYGKTNILESIFLMSNGSTFRQLYSKLDFINIDSESGFAKISIATEENNLELVISNVSNILKSQLKLNTKNTNQRKSSELIKVILFAPYSINITNGTPSDRRTDLDIFLSTCFNEYKSSLKKYKTLLKNRNALIKNIREGKSSQNELEFWTNGLVDTAYLIFKYRILFFNEISQFINDTGSDIYRGTLEFNLEYLPNLETTEANFKSAYLDKYEQNKAKEIIVGKTLYGIHKDDYRFNFGENELRFRGSRGQQRISSFIFKMSQHKYLESKTNINAIFLIDDVMSELDEEHRINLAKYLISCKFQIFITGADIREMPEILIANSKKIEF
ncbi:MAG: DNA replication and repair protein RecF [Candidatus Dojkabacteria bacterium]|nr:DNA replication and repair protein RecF [Candidatus Dojkabacteria bacterium]MDQ7021823.1 DNA replication and repair protein RecF [Candidatus Dojkabacteria bacterium]